MLGEVLGLVSQTSKINDPPHSILSCCHREVSSSLTILLLEIRATSHRMYEVVCGIDVSKCDVQ